MLKFLKIMAVSQPPPPLPMMGRDFIGLFGFSASLFGSISSLQTGDWLARRSVGTCTAPHGWLRSRSPRCPGCLRTRSRRSHVLHGSKPHNHLFGAGEFVGLCGLVQWLDGSLILDCKLCSLISQRKAQFMRIQISTNFSFFAAPPLVCLNGASFPNFWNDRIPSSNESPSVAQLYYVKIPQALHFQERPYDPAHLPAELAALADRVRHFIGAQPHCPTARLL